MKTKNGLQLALGVTILVGTFSEFAENPSNRTIDGVNVKEVQDGVIRTETASERDARMQWWRETKFGLFIHWVVGPAGRQCEPL